MRLRRGASVSVGTPYNWAYPKGGRPLARARCGKWKADGQRLGKGAPDIKLF